MKEMNVALKIKNKAGWTCLRIISLLQELATRRGGMAITGAVLPSIVLGAHGISAFSPVVEGQTCLDPDL